MEMFIIQNDKPKEAFFMRTRHETGVTSNPIYPAEVKLREKMIYRTDS